MYRITGGDDMNKNEHMKTFNFRFIVDCYQLLLHLTVEQQSKE